MGKWLEALRAIDKHDGNEPAKPAKVPFDPFAGSILERSAREKTQPDTVVEENDVTNTSTNEPSKPSKASFDPFDGSERNGNHPNTVGSETNRSTHVSPNTYRKAPAEPAKGPAEAEIHSDRQAATKTISSGNTISKPLTHATTPEPQPPSLSCACCGSSIWWWNGHDHWYCNRCQANINGEGGHPITGEEVMRLVV